MRKVSGGHGIPVELFQILKEDVEPIIKVFITTAQAKRNKRWKAIAGAKNNHFMGNFENQSKRNIP